MIRSLVTILTLVCTLGAALPARAAEKVQLLLPARGAALYPAYVAREVGYFAEEGLDVDLVPGKGSTYVVQQIAAGTALLGWGVPGALLPAVERDQHLKFFYTYAVKNIFDVIVPADSPVKSVADLKGKTIGITNLGSGEVPLVRALLAKANLRPGENVTMTAIGEEAPVILAALRDGRVQAFGGAANDLVWLYEAGLKARSISGEYRDLPSSGLFVTEKTWNERRDLCARVGRAIAKGTLFTLTNFDAAAAIMARVAPEQFAKPQTGRMFLKNYVDLSTPQKTEHGEPLFGYPMLDGWERLQGIFLSGDKPVLKKPVDLKSVVVGDLVPEMNKFDHAKVRAQAKASKP